MRRTIWQSSGLIGEGNKHRQAWERASSTNHRNLSGDKKVAVIGHFLYIEKQLGDQCDLCVLEREPEGSDLLDSACEYILPEQDVVFITGMTLTNKTLPRLLTLTAAVKTILVGPSSPITPKLFSYGVDSIAGFYVMDVDLTRTLVSQAAHTEIFRGGRKITASNHCR